MTDKIRTFIAVSLPEHIIDAIGKAQKAIKKTGFNTRWVKPENIHLTLKFLGDIRPEMLRPITDCMKKCAKDHQPAELYSKGIGVFPGLKRPRVLWTGIRGETDILTAIQNQLDECIRDTGLEKERRPFKGHLTLGRFKGHADSKKLVSVIKGFAEFETESFSADTLILYKSDLTPRGAIYTRLETVSL